VTPPQASFFGCAASPRSLLSVLSFAPAQPTLIWVPAWSAMTSSAKLTGSGSEPSWFCTSLSPHCSKCLHLELSAGSRDRHVKEPVPSIRAFAVDLPAINLHVFQRQKQSVPAASRALHLLGGELWSGDLKLSFHRGSSVDWMAPALRSDGMF